MRAIRACYRGAVVRFRQGYVALAPRRTPHALKLAAVLALSFLSSRGLAQAPEPQAEPGAKPVAPAPAAARTTLAATAAVDDFAMTEPRTEGSTRSVLEDRREAAAMTDGISTEEIARTPADDAADAARRVVGITLVNDRYPYIRGLGGRYTHVLVNGSPLPSPEPNLATVPLDLFPTLSINSLHVAKTFTPDWPGDFAGGSVRIDTITVPAAPLFSLSLAGGYNTQSTFRETLSYPGGRTDWLGFDDGTRALPSEVPREYPLVPGAQRPDGTMVTTDEVLAIGPAMNSQMWTENQTNPINHGGRLLLGNSWELGKDVRLGALASLAYIRTYELREEIFRQFTPAGAGAQDFVPWIDGTAEVASENVKWGALGSVGVKVGEKHDISVFGLHSQLSDNSTSVAQFFSQNDNGTHASTRFDFASRAMDMLQIRGVHDVEALSSARIEWRGSITRAQFEAPDLREVVYIEPQGAGTFSYASASENGLHSFANMEDKGRTAHLDWTQPLIGGRLQKQLKFGAMLSLRDRIFTERRFSFPRAVPAAEPFECGPVYESDRCPRELFTDGNTDGSVLALNENTGPTDAYMAGADVYAGYLMGDLVLVEPLRIIAGARVETTDQRVAAYDPFARQEADDDQLESQLQSVDVLPSGSAIYSITDSLQLRAAGSQTLARPQLQELAPFQFTSYPLGVVTNGNPDLELTKIINADLRLDFFPTDREVLSLSVFFKDFDKPIEPVVIPAASATVLEFQNAEGAILYGAELEARKGLGFMSDVLKDFSVVGNLTIATSEIRVEQTGADASGAGVITNSDRPMFNQPPFVVNLSIDYTGSTGTNVRVLYNVSGKQIVGTGTFGLPDSYQQPRHLLDLTVSQQFLEHFMARLAAENLLNSRYVVTLGKERNEELITRAYRTGIEFTLSLGYTY